MKIPNIVFFGAVALVVLALVFGYAQKNTLLKTATPDTTKSSNIQPLQNSNDLSAIESQLDSVNPDHMNDDISQLGTEATGL